MNILGIIASSTLAAAGDFESIATVSVGSGGAADVEFTSIPATYAHLQIRAITKTTESALKDWTVLRMRFNADTGSNYALHQIIGTGAAAAAGAATSQTFTYGPYAVKSGLADTFAATVMDILDYGNTNKYKTIRTLTGTDQNGAGEISFQSGLWMSSSAITSIKIYPSTANIAQYSHFALYGIKGA